MRNFKTHLQTGMPIEADGLTIEPVSQSFSWIGEHFGVIWSRPYAVRVHGADESSVQIPVVDRTRLGLLFLWGLTAFFSLLAVRNQLKFRR